MPRYLGDSVYAELDEYNRVNIFLNNGNGPEHRIVLEPEVIEELISFIHNNPEKIGV